jgi:hypothetical protein
LKIVVHGRHDVAGLRPAANAFSGSVHPDVSPISRFAKFATICHFPSHWAELNRIAENLIFTPFYEVKPGF